MWKEIGIDAYRGRYLVSSSGGIKSLKSGKILKPGLTSRGYHSVMLYDGSSPKHPVSYTVHRIVAATFLGDSGGKSQLNHIDGNKTNNAADNLEWVTQSENMKHSFANGFHQPARGFAHVNSLLTPIQVIAIRGLAGDRPKNKPRPRHLSDRAIARAFGVSEATVNAVINGKTYRFVSA